MRKRSRSIRSSRMLISTIFSTSVFPLLTSRLSYVLCLPCRHLLLMKRSAEWKCGYQQFRRRVYERAADTDTSARSIDCTRSSGVQWLLLGGHVGAGEMNGERRWSYREVHSHSLHFVSICCALSLPCTPGYLTPRRLVSQCTR
jgi:hypothetical protein